MRSERRRRRWGAKDGLRCGASALAAVFLAFAFSGAGLAAGVGAPGAPGAPGVAAAAAAAAAAAVGGKDYKEILKEYKKILLPQATWKPGDHPRDPLVFRQDWIVVPLVIPGGDIPPVPPPTIPPGEGGKIDLERQKKRYEIAREQFLQQKYESSIKTCAQIIDEIDRNVVAIETSDTERPDRGQRRKLEEAKRYIERADRLKRTAERLQRREKAEREFAVLPIEIEAVIWSKDDKSWAVVNGQMFREEDLRRRKALAGLPKRVLVVGIEPNAVIFSFMYENTAYNIRRESGAVRGVATGVSGTPGSAAASRRTSSPAPGAGTGSTRMPRTTGRTTGSEKPPPAGGLPDSLKKAIFGDLGR